MFNLVVDFIQREPFVVTAACLGGLVLILLVWAWRLKRQVNRAVATGKRLRRELDNSETLLEKGRSLNKDILARLPDAVWKVAVRKRADIDPAAADRYLAGWIASEGLAISRILQARARSAFVRAALSDRAHFLACAEGYCLAALALNPADGDTMTFAREIAAARKADGNQGALAEALSAPLSDDPSSAAGNDPAWTAELLGREAVAQYDQERYGLALAAVESTIALYRQMEEPDAEAILTAQSLKGYVLLGMGRPEEALPIVRIVADDMGASPHFGPDHPDTLSCRYQLALVYEALGRYGDAMAIIRDVVDRQSANVLCGPNHPDTADSRRLMHRLAERGA